MTEDRFRHIHKHVAQRIRELRGKDTLVIAAEKTGLSRSALSRLEIGEEGEITVKQLSRIADGYGKKLSWFTWGL